MAAFGALARCVLALRACVEGFVGSVSMRMRFGIGSPVLLWPRPREGLTVGPLCVGAVSCVAAVSEHTWHSRQVASWPMFAVITPLVVLKAILRSEHLVPERRARPELVGAHACAC